MTSSPVASTDYINALAAGLSYGQNLYVVARVGTAWTSGTSLTIDIQCHEDSSFGSGVETVLTSGAIPVASLTANTTVWVAQLPPKSIEQYIRGYYTPAGTFDAGTIDLFFTPDVPVGW